MNPAHLTPGLPVRVTATRHIAGRTWQGVEGTVWDAKALKGRSDDYVIVQVPDDGLVLIGLRPDEIEAI
jgi:hypothetical protein